MKKNLNIIVLIFEIAAISILHAVKIKQSEKTNQTAIAVNRFSSAKPEARVKSAYIFMKMIK